MRFLTNDEAAGRRAYHGVLFHILEYARPKDVLMIAVGLSSQGDDAHEIDEVVYQALANTRARQIDPTTSSSLLQFTPQ